MFGGDWPVCTLAATYRQWVEALRTIVRDRSERDQRKLFHDNAVAFYRLG
jgi:predicted TIM-barrel fold metal-dependent hydrolase